MDGESDIIPGSRWLEVSTNRVIVIIDPEVYGTGPSWYWEDGGNPKEVNWHYCELNDFITWGRFKSLPEEKAT